MTTPTIIERHKSVDKPTIAVTINGKIGGLSPWDTTLWFAGDVLDVDLVACTAKIILEFPSQISVFGNTFSKFNDTGTSLLGATVRAYPAGSSAAAVQQSVRVSSPIIGNVAPGGAASQCCCATLYTSRPGKSGRGRLYWPATGSLPANYQFDEVNTQNLAIATKNLFQDLSNATADITGGPLVGAVRSLSLGTTNVITSIGVNTQPDRQEHRERHLSFARDQVQL